MQVPAKEAQITWGAEGLYPLLPHVILAFPLPLGLSLEIFFVSAYAV